MEWKTRSFHFELVNETTPKYKAFPTSTLDFEHDYAHEDIARTNQACRNSNMKEILGVTKDPNISNLSSWEQKHSYKQQRREMHSLCMPFQPLILGCDNMRSLFSTKITKMFFKRKMKTHYLNVGHTIVQLISRKEHNPPLDPSIICRMMNSWHFENTSTKILKRGSFNTPNFQMVLQSYLLRKMMDFYACVSIIVDQIDLPSTTGTFCL